MSKSPPEDSDDADETDDILNPAEKLKTAVHSFLRKSANLVNRIFHCHNIIAMQSFKDFLKNVF